jgi:hypothetical protein
MIKRNYFEVFLSATVEDLNLDLRGHSSIPWLDYWLNPRRLRGSDFLMRWSQGVWSEERLVASVNSSDEFFALPYGPSGVAPDDDPRKFELYFERLERAGMAGVKRPDLLIFRTCDREKVEEFVRGLGGAQELPFTTEGALDQLLRRAIMGIECENSLWVASRMPAYGRQLTPQKSRGGKLGLRKTAVLPTVILKDEDIEPLRQWEEQNKIPIHIWHVFFDLAFGISFRRASDLIEEGLIEPTKQIFQAPSGVTTTKVIYKIYYQYAYPLAASATQPELKAAFIEDKNGHILPYVKFEGGSLALTPEAFRTMHETAQQRIKSRING